MFSIRYAALSIKQVKYISTYYIGQGDGPDGRGLTLRPITEIVISNPVGGMDVCLFWVFCVVRYRCLRWDDHSFGGVLPNVMRRCVWFRNLNNEEPMARAGPQRQWVRNIWQNSSEIPRKFWNVVIEKDRKDQSDRSREKRKKYYKGSRKK